MKKVLILIISLLVFIPNVYAKEKTTVSVFYSESCIHCKHLHTYLDELEKDETYNKMFKVDYYEIHDSTNSSLFDKVLAYFKKSSSGVPFYVIGDKYEVGFPNSETMQEQYEKQDKKIKELIEKAYKNNQMNIVKEIDEGKVKVTTTVKETLPLVEENNVLVESNKKPFFNKYMLIGIIPAVLIIAAVLIVFKLKKEVKHEE
ncbi:MAG: hypothetical protein K6E99_03645 [Bacilli bacterium]|nr:hypothetical protein [Bacilli bacterium]